MNSTLTLNDQATGSCCSRQSATAPTWAGWVDRQARQLLINQLSTMQGGSIELSDPLGNVQLGQGGELVSEMRVHRPQFYRHAVLGGSLSVAESYLRGDWDCDDLTAFFRLFVRNMEATQKLDRGLSQLSQWVNRLYHRWHANTKDGSRRNIHAHYDLGNDFFQLMLDETMAYSSGIFLSPESTLHDASVEKIDRLCRQLELQPSDHLLEIGTGWGGLALHAAQQYGCRVTTTTISQQQYDVAKKRIQDAGLSDRVTLLLTDYRDLTGQYDKLVSVEMIEAVGHQYLDTYFAQCSHLLKPNGCFALQAITIPDRRYAQYLKSVDFIQKYIFPGGCLPSLAAIQDSIARVTDLRMVETEDFGPHYARTLREWRQRFHDRLDEVYALGYPERFVRMWDYYLCYCEAAFDEHYTGVVQVLFDKPQCRRRKMDAGGTGPLTERA